MSLSWLPNEILVRIGLAVERDRDLSAFMRTNRFLFELLEGHLYRRISLRIASSQKVNFRKTALFAIIKSQLRPDSSFKKAFNAIDQNVIVFDMIAKKKKALGANDENIMSARRIKDGAFFYCARYHRISLMAFQLSTDEQLDLNSKYIRFLSIPLYDKKYLIINLLILLMDEQPIGVDTILTLIRTGKLDLNERDIVHSYPLLLAIENGLVDIVRLLLEYGVDLTNSQDELDRGTGILQAAIKSGNTEILQMLLTTGKMNARACVVDELTALHIAVLYNAPEMLLLLLKVNGDDINLQDSTGATPLWYAVNSNEKIDIVRILVSHQETDVNIPNTDGMSPLHVARLLCNEEIAMVLIQAGAEFVDDFYFAV